jgi:hypothetical protein
MTVRRTRARTPEGAVQRACLDLLRFRGVLAFRFNSGSLRAPDGRPVTFISTSDGQPFAGFSDLGGLLPPTGRWLAVECKAPKGKLTDRQRLFLEAVIASGGVGIVVSDVEVLVQVLADLVVNPMARFTIEGEREP